MDYKNQNVRLTLKTTENGSNISCAEPSIVCNNTSVYTSNTCPEVVHDLRLRGTVLMPSKDIYSSGLIKPFQKPRLSFMSSFVKELRIVASDQRSRKIFLLGILNFICSCFLLICCRSTNSMALTAYTYLTFFDFMVLLSCLLSIWVEQQSQKSQFTYGYERFEVLAVFASTILAQLGSFFIIKESIERILVLPEIHMGRFLMGTVFAFFCHVIITYGVNNKSWNHVMSAAGSSWLQEHVADMSQSLCHFIPGLSSLLLPRVNPMLLIAFTGGIALFVTQLVIEVNNYRMADPLAAVGIALMTCGTMFPMSVYSGKILLQTSPSHIVGQLDKCLREASTLDGVLEFRNEHFWTLSFGVLVGTLHVRIRRDANEQLVLAHLMDRLSNLVSILTIQVFKDDWTRNTTFQLLNDMALLTATKSPVSTTESTFSHKLQVLPSNVDHVQRPTTMNYSSYMQQTYPSSLVNAGPIPTQNARVMQTNPLIQFTDKNISLVAKSAISTTLSPISELR